MTTHFPTVPVEGALRSARLHLPDRLRPLALVVNEDPMITSTLGAILNLSGFAALMAHDSIAALETALVIPPEILIADFSMPRLSGFELALHIAYAAPDCEVILFAGNSTQSNLPINTRILGRRFRLLLKPVHPVDLLDTICDLLKPHGYIDNAQAETHHRTLRERLSGRHAALSVSPAAGAA